MRTSRDSYLTIICSGVIVATVLFVNTWSWLSFLAFPISVILAGLLYMSEL